MKTLKTLEDCQKSLYGLVDTTFGNKTGLIGFSSFKECEKICKELNSRIHPNVNDMYEIALLKEREGNKCLEYMGAMYDAIDISFEDFEDKSCYSSTEEYMDGLRQMAEDIDDPNLSAEGLVNDEVLGALEEGHNVALNEDGGVYQIFDDKQMIFHREGDTTALYVGIVKVRENIYEAEDIENSVCTYNGDPFNVDFCNENEASEEVLKIINTYGIEEITNTDEFMSAQKKLDLEEYHVNHIYKCTENELLISFPNDYE